MKTNFEASFPHYVSLMIGTFQMNTEWNIESFIRAVQLMDEIDAAFRSSVLRMIKHYLIEKTEEDIPDLKL